MKRRRWVIEAVLGAGLLALFVFGARAWVMHRMMLEHSGKAFIDFHENEVIERLEVTDSTSNVLWALANPARRSFVRLDYGGVPTGLIQTFPPGRVPVALQLDKPVWVAVSFAGGGWLRTATQKDSRYGYLYGVATSGPAFGRPSDAELFRLPAKQ